MNLTLRLKIEACFSLILFMMEISVGFVNLADVECGRQPVRVNPKFRTARIAGGREAFHGEFPWMVSLHTVKFGGTTKHRCGGFLVNRTTVVSVAHCFMDQSRQDRFELFPRHNLLIYVGEHVIGEPESPNAKAFKVNSINVHPEYSITTQRNDIALVHLDGQLDWDPYVQPACLSNSDAELEDGQVTQLAGWGTTSNHNHEGSKTLMAAELNIMNRADCENEHNREKEHPPWKSWSKQFCAEHANKNQGGCKGDSGSPLMLKDPTEGIFSIIGIHAQGGRDCGSSMLPSIYTKVSSYVNWIQTNIP